MLIPLIILVIVAAVCGAMAYHCRDNGFTERISIVFGVMAVLILAAVIMIAIHTPIEGM